MTTKLYANTDQLVDQVLPRFLELAVKLPFEPWSVLGKEFLSIILAFTIFQLYGKMLSAICHGLVKLVRYLFGVIKRGWAAAWVEHPAAP